jgi:hypothetical protein
MGGNGEETASVVWLLEVSSAWQQSLQQQQMFTMFSVARLEHQALFRFPEYLQRFLQGDKTAQALRA